MKNAAYMTRLTGDAETPYLYSIGIGVILVYIYIHSTNSLLMSIVGGVGRA